MAEYDEMNLKEKVDIIFESLQEANKSKIKPLKLPRKAKVKKGKLKKGYIGILKIHENRNITADKVKIEDSSFVLKEKEGKTYHATDGNEILFWQGKFPVIIQPMWKKNPLLVRTEGEKNEVYGQKNIMNRMIRDAIPMKKKFSAGIIIWIVLGIGAAYLLTKLIK